jgi:hypothetical protein
MDLTLSEVSSVKEPLLFQDFFEQSFIYFLNSEQLAMNFTALSAASVGAIIQSLFRVHGEYFVQRS